MASEDPSLSTSKPRGGVGRYLLIGFFAIASQWVTWLVFYFLLGLLTLGALLPWVLPYVDISAWASRLWPILLALAVAARIARSGLRAPALPPGDILLVLERGLQYLRYLLAITTRKSTP